MLLAHAYPFSHGLRGGAPPWPTTPFPPAPFYGFANQMFVLLSVLVARRRRELAASTTAAHPLRLQVATSM